MVSVVEPLEKVGTAPTDIEKLTQSGAEMAKVNDGTVNVSTSASTSGLERESCPYCSGKNIIKRGKREKKYESQQRYLCNDCQRSFVGQNVKGKSFPLKLILEGISYYNTGFTLEEACRFLKEKSGLEVKPSTLSGWVEEFEPLCRYSRLRPYGLKLFSPNQVIQTAHLYHHQVYDFSVHRGKLALLLQEYKNNKFDNLREFLEAIQSECPHQFFKEGLRASELKVDFSLEEVIIREKQNFANRIAGLVLQAVSDNKLRHRSLQDFMLRNDSVTVAVEVPLYMDQMDLEHMQEELEFKIPLKLDKVLTGHIDILQLRNGAVHILDYKPQDKDKRRLKPVTQLTLYALMLSRLTGLRLYDFKCALAL
jgi:transposase-like protein